MNVVYVCRACGARSSVTQDAPWTVAALCPTCLNVAPAEVDGPPHGAREQQARRDVLAALQHQFAWEDLIGPGRSQELTEARHLGMRVLRKQHWSFREIGELFGDRDHKTVMHACKKMGP